MHSAKVRLGETPVTRIGLGTNRLRQSDENVALIQKAVAAGVEMIDTAHSYAGGESEATIGATRASLSFRSLAISTRR